MNYSYLIKPMCGSILTLIESNGNFKVQKIVNSMVIAVFGFGLMSATVSYGYQEVRGYNPFTFSKVSFESVSNSEKCSTLKVSNFVTEKGTSIWCEDNRGNITKKMISENLPHFEYGLYRSDGVTVVMVKDSEVMEYQEVLVREMELYALEIL
ncbi:hypothetical protein QTV43_000509 [Vibrio vulnificus]|nr:hypothetical protein [Vibrio vulnificus]